MTRIPARILLSAPFLCACLLLPWSLAKAAQTLQVSLTVGGIGLECASSQVFPGVLGAAEAFSLGSNLTVESDPGTGQPTGQIRVRPIRIMKQLDECTPLLTQALVQGQTVEVIFRFFRQVPGGEVEHYFTISLPDARVSSQSIVSPDTLDPASVNRPPLESVSFIFSRITWTYEPTGNGFEHDFTTLR
ncbi:MAG: type VI secretion system tube protein TssD [Myxococcota bacterium]